MASKDHTKPHASGRAGKVSAVDNPTRSQSSKQKKTEPTEAEPEPSQSSGRASRAAKSALLENPPWASLKPKSKSKSSGSKSAAPKERETAPAHHGTGNSGSDDKAEKRKRSGSVEAHRAPRPKKLKSSREATTVSTKTKPKFPGRRTHRAPSIDADGTDDQDGKYNDSGDDAGDKSVSSDEASSTEEKYDSVSQHILQAEQAKIISHQPSKAAQQNPSKEHLKSRVPSLTSSEPAGPPTSDIEEIPGTSPAGDASEADLPSKEKMTRRQIKLEEERPVILPNPAQAAPHKRTSNATRAPSQTVKRGKDSTTHATTDMSESAASDEETKPWKSRTKLKIFKKTKKTSAIGLKDQNADIQKVVHGSYEFAQVALVVGDPDVMLEMSNDAVLKMSTPFSMGGLEKIALCSLIKAAESLGYDGEYDIAHRLEEGSERFYIEPLVNYVAQRLSLIRSSFKKCINMVAPSHLGLQTNSHQHNNNLLHGNSFVYPWSEDEGFDRAKPFRSPVIAKTVECAFFTAGSQYNNLGLEFAGRLTSSSDTQVGQREVSLFMVALASVGVASVIQDSILGRSTDFAGSQLDSLFKKLVVILLTLRRSKPVTYHNLTHSIYSAAVGEKPVNLASSDLTAKEILGEVNWDLIDD